MKSATTYAVFFALLLTAQSVNSAVIRVPSDQPTIQLAINVARDGDTVLVAPGRYVENIHFWGKAVNLVGEIGPDVTMLSPGRLYDPTIKVENVYNGSVVVKGFTVSGGRYASTVTLSHCSAIIEDNVFTDNITPDAPNVEVISCRYTSSTIRHNLFYDNGGIACVGLRNGTGGTAIINNTFDRNNRGIYSIALGGTAVNNIITNSTGYGVAVSDPIFKFDLLDHNDIWNNNPDYMYFAVAGTNDLSADPLFVNPDRGVYDLQGSSSCIDAGYPDSDYTDPDGTICDIGASFFYHDVSCCVGDRGNVNGDDQQLIDLADLHFLISYLHKCGPEPPCLDEADVNGDGDINQRDLACLARYMFSRGNACQLAECP